MGHSSVIRSGDIQVMSAGTGVFHSEYNASASEIVHLLQIWIIPNQLNVPPRYQQVSFNQQMKNNFQLLIAPKGEGGKSWIHQEAWLSIGQFDNQQVVEYTLHNKQSGVYAFIVSGEANINEVFLAEKDALGIIEASVLTIEIKAEKTKVLLIEVPMQLASF